MRLAVKVLLGWFALFGLGIGLWQAAFPASFHADFPGWGHSWVSPDGPYNEHLVRDVGLGNLAVGTVALVALLTGVVWVARAVGLAVVVLDLPHQLYHQVHVSVLPTTTDQVLQSASLTATSLAAVALLVLTLRLPAAVPPAAPRADSRTPVPTRS
ncbi:hypothetical protein SAMN05660464_1173 [Geodermatophilus dictyosporus]|uniref:Uncharacterized protein n=1 Tax=Geodermatophilus dictyosporus TaxID=1523247 RepID=A0A1I5K1F2_9ACTN|nr:hypothetical protein [Geodermatophilus dictyosporus]SFO78461.1 hypothetical protein SAMN05660464_1173 [Geodermatophilus dictyosporus]